MLENQPCPCGSNIGYENCCGRFHPGHARPGTAEQLMRSRYSAWALKRIDYIIDTTWPGQRRYLRRADLVAWANATEWQQLEIVDTCQGKTGDTLGEVEFRATYLLKETGRTDIHQERSSFVCEEGQWFFIDPTITTGNTIGRNDPCPCGSGKKYKKCCMDNR